MADKPAQKCNKCGCLIIWDFSLDPPPATKRTKKGWWKEDLSKEMHNLDRCTNFQNSKEFLEEQSVQNAQTNTNVKEAPSPLQAKKMSVSDFAEQPMREEVRTHCKFLQIIEDEIRKELGNDANPARVGLYIKIIQELMEKK
jgi:hypothetical protein